MNVSTGKQDMIIMGEGLEAETTTHQYSAHNLFLAGNTK